MDQVSDHTLCGETGHLLGKNKCETHPKYSAHAPYQNTINTLNTCERKKYNTPSIILRGSGSQGRCLSDAFHWLELIQQKPIRVKEQQTSHGFKITEGIVSLNANTEFK